MNDSKILQALEQLGAQYPWDRVSIWLQREPAGEVRFVAYIDADYNRGVSSAMGAGATLAEACSHAAKDAGNRDPEITREQKILELKRNISKLEAAQFGPPPYRPGTLLAPGAMSMDIQV